MKAIKINNIQWNLEGLDSKEKEKAMKNLPVAKAFMAEDDFCVENTPRLMKKKYGYDIITCTYNIIKVVNSLEDLLNICRPSDDKKEKALYKVNHGLSAYGERCLQNLEEYIQWRINLDRQGTSEYDMPVILDEVMIGLENVTGMKWDKKMCYTVKDWMNPVMNILKSRKNRLQDMEEMEDEE